MNEQYVNMCRKAVEIQENWNPEEHDYIAVSYRERENNNETRYKIVRNEPTGVFDAEDMMMRVGEGYNWMTWLPTQKQLQDMIDCEYSQLIYDFYEYLTKQDSNEIHEQYCNIFNSFEELWINYIMQSVFHKRWDGNDWKKTEE